MSFLNGCCRRHSGCFRGEGAQAVHRKHHLGVHGLLAPQRSVVVEGGDALGGRKEVGTPSRVTFSTNEMMARLGPVSFHEGNGSAARAISEAK